MTKMTCDFDYSRPGGGISFEETQTCTGLPGGRAPPTREEFDSVDFNGDGIVTMAEWQRWAEENPDKIKDN